MFLWMPKEHLYVLVYLVTVMHSMQAGYMEKAQKYTDKALLQIEKLQSKLILIKLTEILHLQITLNHYVSFQIINSVFGFFFIALTFILFLSCRQQTDFISFPTDVVGAHNNVPFGHGKQNSGFAGDIVCGDALSTASAIAGDSRAATAHAFRALFYEHELHGGCGGSVPSSFKCELLLLQIFI